VTPEDEPHIARERKSPRGRAAARDATRVAQGEPGHRRQERSESNISQLERGAEERLSTVAGYIDALGGKLEVLAMFGEETIRTQRRRRHRLRALGSTVVQRGVELSPERRRIDRGIPVELRLDRVIEGTQAAGIHEVARDHGGKVREIMREAALDLRQRL
jgi:hypothetical protein